MTDERGDGVTGVRIPDDARVVVADGGQEGAIRTPRHSVQGAGVSGVQVSECDVTLAARVGGVLTRFMVIRAAWNIVRLGWGSAHRLTSCRR